MNTDYISFVNENYEFKFTIAHSGNEVVLKDREGFNFLSMRLSNAHSKLLDKDVALNIIAEIKPVIEKELGEAQKRWKSQKQESDSILQKKLFSYIERLEYLEKQLNEATDELDIILIEAQINRLAQLIVEARTQLDV